MLNIIKKVNSYLKRYFKPHKKIKDEYIVDATPVACDINIVKKYISDDHLKKLGLKWSYSTTKKSFIGFKVTVVLEKNSLTPVSILIHPGAPHDSRIFEGILKELKRRRLIKPGDILYFDIGYVRQEASLFSIELSENRDIFNPCCVGFPPLKLLIQ